MVPIPKNNGKSVHDSDYYRGTALSSCLGKVLDHVILKNKKEVFKTSYNPFRFKSGASTTQCSFAVNEVIRYYTKGNSNVYTVINA